MTRQLDREFAKAVRAARSVALRVPVPQAQQGETVPWAVRAQAFSTRRSEFALALSQQPEAQRDWDRTQEWLAAHPEEPVERHVRPRKPRPSASEPMLPEPVNGFNSFAGVFGVK